MKSFFEEKYLDVYLDYFKQSKKHFVILRYTTAFLLTFMVSFLVFFFNKLPFLIAIPVVFYVGYKFPYWNLLMQKKKKDLIVSYIFPQFLQAFIALLPTSGNIYQTLAACIPYTSEPLKSKLEELVDNIYLENDRKYYLEFAEFVGTSEAYMIMDIIYQFSEYGVRKETLNKLKNYIDNLHENKVDEMIERKVLSIEKHGHVPIFISLFVTLSYAAVIIWYYLKDINDILDMVFNMNVSGG